MSFLVSPSNKQVKTNDRWHSAAQQLAETAGVGFNGTEPWDIQVQNPCFYRRLFQEGLIGLGESYMEGWWECERLDLLFTRLVEAHLGEKMPKQLPILISLIWARIVNRQSRQRAWIVGEEHYDLGNDLFEVMLDSRMQYSCAYWQEANSLEEAQASKLDLICLSWPSNPE